MFKQIGPLEISLIVIVLLLLFGAKRLPEIGKGVGKSLREFKSATKGLGDDMKTGLTDEDEDESEGTPPQAAAPKSKGNAKG
jgi:sec-independent protein translocase protein TatA